MRIRVSIIVSALVALTALPLGAADKPKAEKKKAGEAQAAPVEKEEAASGAADVKAPPEAPKEDGRRSALRSLVVLKVINPKDAKTAVRAEAERLKGYMSYADNRSIILKVPPKSLTNMIQFAADQGLVIEKTLEREDLTMEIAELEGRLKSKREILSRLRGFFDDSDAVATLEIEQTMNGLVIEIEQARGRLRFLNDRSDWAILNISFQFRERDKVMYVESEFEWINTASLDQFLTEF